MIVLVIGTNRPNSNTAKVAGHVADIYRSKGADLHVIDLGKMPSSIFSPSAYADKPSEFQPFSMAILNASGIVWVTPEYNGGIPGIAKYFIDMMKFPESLVGVPTTFVGLSAGMWGALRPIEQLEAIFKYRRALIYPERVHLMPIDDLIGKDGKISSEDHIRRINRQAEGFLKFVGQVKQEAAG